MTGAATAGLLIFFLFWTRTAMSTDASAGANHLKEAISAADRMVQVLQDGDAKGFDREGSAFVSNAQAAAEELTGAGGRADELAGHLQMAVREAQDALKYGREGQLEEALDRAFDALSHAEEANSLIDSIIPPEGNP